MSYTALYRKWRPSVFEDVKGQDHIVKTLKNQINKERIGHAYLFCGTRGTGKTSIAKIFARAVNCENPADGSPCNVCPTCQGILSGSSMNVAEIDAASNNGVDNIREIRDEVQYSPTAGRFRVYIIDEVHMLSTGAFNALLKTLEEPPPYVIFILATTEAHRIPITVLSRCQRYDFKRISTDTIAESLAHLMQEEGIEAELKALKHVAKAGDGSMRDSLSLLEQCIAFHFGEKLTYDHVLDVLGAVDNSVYHDMLMGILDEKPEACMLKLEEIIMQGRDLNQFITDFIWYLRNLLMVKSMDNPDDMLDMSEDGIKGLKEDAGRLHSDTLIRFIRVFSELSNQIRYGTQKRILIEMAIIKLARPQMESNYDSILQRLREIEKKLEAGVPLAAAPVAATAVEPVALAAAPTEAEKVALPVGQLKDLTMIRDDWQGIIRELGSTFLGTIPPTFRDTIVEPSGEGILTIVFPDNTNYSIGSRPEIMEAFKDFVMSKYKKTIEFRSRLRQAGEKTGIVYVSDEDLQVINMDIVIEDE